MNIKPGTPLFDFYADLLSIAEDKFRANLQDDSEGWVKALHAEYAAAGSPKERRKWILHRIQSEFKSMDKPPAWTDMDNSHWPFHKGKPMVFLTQIRLKAKAETKDLLDDGATVYIFGFADVGEYGEVKMVYQEVTITVV